MSLGDEMHQDPVYAEIIREPLEIMGVSELGDSAVVIRGAVHDRAWNAMAGRARIPAADQAQIR